jgi:hypothetical protein
MTAFDTRRKFRVIPTKFWKNRSCFKWVTGRLNFPSPGPAFWLAPASEMIHSAMGRNHTTNSPTESTKFRFPDSRFSYLSRKFFWISVIFLTLSSLLKIKKHKASVLTSLWSVRPLAPGVCRQLSSQHVKAGSGHSEKRPWSWTESRNQLFGSSQCVEHFVGRKGAVWRCVGLLSWSESSHPEVSRLPVFQQICQYEIMCKGFQVHTAVLAVNMMPCTLEDRYKRFYLQTLLHSLRRRIAEDWRSVT